MKNKKLKGGAPGTSGNVGTLVDDIIATIQMTGRTIYDSVEVVRYIVDDIPASMGVAFNENAAPNPDNVSIR